MFEEFIVPSKKREMDVVFTFAEWDGTTFVKLSVIQFKKATAIVGVYLLDLVGGLVS